MRQHRYAFIHCGGHILAQIDTDEFPISFGPRKKHNCPACGSKVDLNGCSKHHNEKVK